MTDLEAMAREAGMVPLLTPAWDLSEADQDWRVCTADLTRFAVLVRARALEEAARVLDGVDNYANPMTARDCAAAIRALPTSEG